MTSPYYTAVPAPPVATAGPVDPNAGTRAKVYSGLALVMPLLGFLGSFGIFSANQVNAVSGAITAVIGLLGAFGFGFAATKTRQQVKNGTFDPPPVPDVPLLDAFQSISALKERVDATVNDAQAKVQDGVNAIQNAASLIPGVGPLIGPVSDLAEAAPGVLADLFRSVLNEAKQKQQ